MKVASIIAFAALTVASVHATGPVGSTCSYGTTAPPATPDPTTATPPPATPVDCKLFTALTDPKPWGECADDGAGKWYRTKILGIEAPAENGGAPCPNESDPTRVAKDLCPPENCKALTPEADQGLYGPCTKNDDGKYVKSKVLGVDVPAKFGGTCDEKERTYTQPCDAIDCVPLTDKEDKGPFGECQADDSGKWYKSKVLGIKTPASNGGLDCEPEDKRVYKELCEAVNCKPVDAKDDKGEFGACEKDAEGKYVKSKVLPVKDEAQFGGTCDPKDRTVTEPCAAIACEAFTEKTDLGEFGECKENSEGKWFKYKILGIKTPAQYGGAECESEEKRTISQLCDPVDCKALTPEADQGPYGECTKNDEGKYLKSKVLGVDVPALYGGKCDEKDRMYAEPCKAVDCEPYTTETDKGEFGECKDIDNSGTFFKYKVLGIRIPAQYGGLDCESEEKRTVREFCDPINCKSVDEKDDKGEFGECEKDAVTGEWFKSKVLAVKDEAQFGGTCDPKDRTVKQPCAAINCEAFTKETDKGEFGECKDIDNSGKFYKYKVLGIKTPAQFGGLECESEEKRTISEFCEPVNCKPVDAKDDTGSFGECTLDAAAQTYYKSKVLAIKDPAQNGGTCLENDRTVKELCPAVNCVPYKESEDQGKFGACQKFPDGKYYRTKVLGIKEAAKYGGTCPSEAERTVKQPCPNDGYCVPSDPFYDVCVPKLAQCGTKKDNTIYLGYDISVTKGLALWQCCDKCATTSGCVAYSFERNSDAKRTECNLKWKIGDESFKRNAVSSSAKAPLPKKCTYRENYMFYPGLAKSLATFETDDMDACCAACAKRSDCKGFNLQHHTCYLEAKVGTTYFFLGGNSGIKV